MSMDRGVSMTRRSTIDWVVPTVEDKVRLSPRASNASYMRLLRV